MTFRDLLRRFGTAGAAIEALPDLSRRGGRRRPLKACSVPDAQAGKAAIQAVGGTLITLGERHPPYLAAIEDARRSLAWSATPRCCARGVSRSWGLETLANGQRFAERLFATCRRPVSSWCRAWPSGSMRPRTGQTRPRHGGGNRRNRPSLSPCQHHS